MPDELEAEPLSPAANHAIQVSPQLVMACQDDPELLVALARGQLAIVQDRLVRKVLSNPDATVGQFAIVHERLSKIAKIEGNQASLPGGGQQVIINIIRAPGKEQVTIEGQAQRVEAQSE